MIKDLTDGFAFPDADEDAVTPQMLHDLCIALGATCKHCKRRKTLRRKALHRGDNRADVLARAKLRRLALLQDVDLAVAETETAPL